MNSTEICDSDSIKPLIIKHRLLKKNFFLLRLKPRHAFNRWRLKNRCFKSTLTSWNDPVQSKTSLYIDYRAQIFPVCTGMTLTGLFCSTVTIV